MNKKVAIIIPSRKTDNIDTTIEYVLDYDSSDIEIYSAKGNHPTKQRNECIKLSNASIIYFIDNDSIVEKSNIKNAMKLFASDENIAVVGGPSIHKITTKIQEDINICLSSSFCVGRINNRYNKKHKKPFDCDDKYLILCNLFIRKDVLEKLDYFNENLYPNEENDFIDRVLASGYRAIHHPDIIVCREPRRNVKEYIKMLLSYGCGRFEQMKEKFVFKNIVFILPMLFMFYIISIPILSLVFPLLLDNIYSQNFVIENINKLYFIPFLLYIIADLFFTIYNSLKRKSSKLRSIFVLPVMFFFTHFFYGLGFFYGIIKNIFIRNKSRNEYEINIKKI